MIPRPCNSGEEFEQMAKVFGFFRVFVEQLKDKLEAGV